jgi:ABC-type oligopeptide transport system substrate-binding subunit
MQGGQKMKRILFAAAGAAFLAALAACAHGNGSAEKSTVRVVTNAQDVSSCEKLSAVRLQGTWTTGSAKEALEKMVQEKGGNVLLLGGSSEPNSGVAYRCSAGTGGGAQ